MKQSIAPTTSMACVVILTILVIAVAVVIDRHTLTIGRPSMIEQTRQPGAGVEPASFAPTPRPPRGVLHAVGSTGASFLHERLAPSARLAPWIAHVWMVEWDSRGFEPAWAETMPHPNCHLLFEHDLSHAVDHASVRRKAEVCGVATGKFSRAMQGHCRVVGLKFRPGGLRPFLSASVSTLTDRIVPASDCFGDEILVLADRLRRLTSGREMADAVDRHFENRLPESSADVERAARVVDLVSGDRDIPSVERLAERAAQSVRSLQRLFSEFVGVSPKWVIRRYRLHEVLERLNAREPLDFARLALDLGYADQAHLIRDFRGLTGYTPTAYSKRIAPGTAATPSRTRTGA